MKVDYIEKLRAEKDLIREQIETNYLELNFTESVETRKEIETVIDNLKNHMLELINVLHDEVKKTTVEEIDDGDTEY